MLKLQLTELSGPLPLHNARIDPGGSVSPIRIRRDTGSSPASSFRLQPAADQREAGAGLLLRAAQFEIADEMQRLGIGQRFLILGRAGPGFAPGSGMDGIGLARRAEHEGRRQADLVLDQQLAAQLRHVLARAKHRYPRRETLAHRPRERDLRGTQRRQPRMRADRGGIGDQRRGPAIQRAPLEPLLSMGERDGVLVAGEEAGDRIEERGDGHGRVS